MSEVRGVVVAHGNLARCLVETVEGIAGLTGALVPISNVDSGPDTLEERIREAAAGADAVIFVDLASGSCAHAARCAGRDDPTVAVLTGVNLPVLLDFVFHRDMALPELAARLVERAHAGTAAHLDEPPA